MKYHYQPPKQSNYRNEEEFLKALEEWERKEDEYWDDLQDENN